MFHDIMTNGNNKMRFKDSNMATSQHEDTGFCSGDDYMEHELHSPTDSSEDSVEVKVSTITFNHKKRKMLEEARICKETTFSGPLKKRMCLKVKAEANDVNTMLTGKTPFRPWSPSKPMQAVVPNFAVPQTIKLETPCVQVTPEVNSGAFSYFCPSPSPIAQQQTEPVSLVIKREKDIEFSCTDKPTISDTRVPIHPQITRLTPAETERMILKSHEQFPGLQACGPSSQPASYSSQNHQDIDNDTLGRHESKREQRNYKNMTRERRIEANARERTRVHTISAAFDTLRRSVPAYSHNQKLSKLSVLRIACSYIMTLSSLVQDDDETPSSDPPTSECVEQVSRTIQREGKLRKKKDDND